MAKKRLIILGSTGSIGTQALDVVRCARDRFDVVGLAANTNTVLLQKQAHEFGVEKTVATQGRNERMVELIEAVPAEVVLVAVSGTAGLAPILAAIRAGRDIALANKEALVMAGDAIMNEARKAGVRIIPVDSEHSAIFQCLHSVKKEDVEKIILTCSGGTFRGKTRDELTRVTAEEALRHPTWNMGRKITIDSATLVNKGFELIEAHHLFGFDYDRIEVKLHPQSRVHGMVQLKDGNTLMHMAPPDMRIPIHYALHYPNRVPLPPDFQIAPYDPTVNTTLEFFEPDHETFPGIKLALEAARQGGLTPALFTLANDRAVQDFLDGRIGFLDIYDRLREALREPRADRTLSVDNIMDLITSAW